MVSNDNCGTDVTLRYPRITGRDPHAYLAHPSIYTLVISTHASRQKCVYLKTNQTRKGSFKGQSAMGCSDFGHRGGLDHENSKRVVLDVWTLLVVVVEKWLITGV